MKEIQSPSSSKKRVLVGVTGSVATIKLREIVTQLQSKGFATAVVLTDCATRFLDSVEGFSDLDCFYFTDADEWTCWRRRGDLVLHIELRRWADLLVIAPLDANTMGKIASGLCDNLLTCVVRAWDMTKPLVYCPAMNTHMYVHPVTTTHRSTLKTWGYHEVESVAKKLMCNDVGLGAMAGVESIIDRVVELLK